jgi:hypothetical protein
MLLNLRSVLCSSLRANEVRCQLPDVRCRKEQSVTDIMKRLTWLWVVNAAALRAGMMASRLNHRERVIPALTDHLEDKGGVIGTTSSGRS